MEVLPEDILTKPLNNFGSSARRSGRHKRVVGVLLASTASLAAARPAGLATASVAPLSDDFSRKQRKLTGGYVMTDSTIRTAVKAWLADATAAEVTYGHISTWETGGVTNMAYLFCNSANSGDITLGCNTAAVSFNEDIGAWDTSAVTTMYQTFYQASSFNQPLGDWQIDAVTSIYRTFYGASAFDQDLGWCVGVDLDQSDAFHNTACASSLCGVSIRAIVRCGSVMDNWSIYVARDAWLSNIAWIRRGDVRPYFYVGDQQGDGHVGVVLRTRLLRRCSGGRILQRGPRRVGHLWRHKDARHVRVRQGL